jgi:hypothetical protein
MAKVERIFVSRTVRCAEAATTSGSYLAALEEKLIKERLPT